VKTLKSIWGSFLTQRARGLPARGASFLRISRARRGQFERPIPPRARCGRARGHYPSSVFRRLHLAAILKRVDAFHRSVPGVQSRCMSVTDKQLKTLKSGVTTLVSCCLIHRRRAGDRPIAVGARGNGCRPAESPRTDRRLTAGRLSWGCAENWRSWRGLLDSACDRARLPPWWWTGRDDRYLARVREGGGRDAVPHESIGRHACRRAGLGTGRGGWMQKRRSQWHGASREIRLLRQFAVLSPRGLIAFGIRAISAVYLRNRPIRDFMAA